MSSLAQLPPADLLAQVAKRLRADGHDYESGAPATGMSREWVRQLLEGELRGKVTRGTRAKLEAYLSGSAAGSVGEPRTTYDVTHTPLGDAVLIAVGRFEFIEEMAGKLREMAGRGGQELRAAVPPTSPSGSPLDRMTPATHRDDLLRKARPRRHRAGE